jgi:hypothetical protein
MGDLDGRCALEQRGRQGPCGVTIALVADASGVLRIHGVIRIHKGNGEGFGGRPLHGDLAGRLVAAPAIDPIGHQGVEIEVDTPLLPPLQCCGIEGPGGGVAGTAQPIPTRRSDRKNIHLSFS